MVRVEVMIGARGALVVRHGTHETLQSSFLSILGIQIVIDSV